MHELIQTIINGLTTGFLYALIALGYTMVYGVLKLLNFAHGDVYMVGAYIGYFVIQWFGGPTSLSIPVPLLVAIMFLVAGLGCGVLGVGIERFAYRPLRDAPRIAPLITALGVSLHPGELDAAAVRRLHQELQHRAFISLDRRHPHRRRRSSTPVQITIFVVSIVMMFGLMRLVDRTTLGKSMRAVASDREAAEMLGINVDRVISLHVLHRLGDGRRGRASCPGSPSTRSPTRSASSPGSRRSPPPSSAASAASRGR